MTLLASWLLVLSHCLPPCSSSRASPSTTTQQLQQQQQQQSKQQTVSVTACLAMQMFLVAP
jgi:hypothetical protein